MNSTDNSGATRESTVLVGLTGSIGSGKSTVARLFSKAGIPVLQADDIAKELMTSDPEVIAAITGILGEEAYRNGELNRTWIADQIFSDHEKLEAVNAVVHPRTFMRQGEAAAGLFAEGFRVVACEAALIFESGGEGRFDYIVVVDADRGKRLERAARRDGVEVDEIRRREAAQIPAERKVELADFVIRNDGSIEELEGATRFIISLLLSLPPRHSIERSEDLPEEQEGLDGEETSDGD